MEREGRGRRGGEIVGRGIIVGGIILSLFIGCNNGLAELEKEKESILSISNLRQGFLDVFATFGNMVSGAFGIKAETTKKDVGDHFDGLSKKIQEVLKKVQQLTTNTGDSKEAQGDVLSVAVNKAGEVLTKLKKNLDLLAKIGGSDTEKVGEVPNSNKQGAIADVTELKNAHKALKEIVAAATSIGVEELKERNVALTETGLSPTPEHGAKVLTTGADAGAAVVDKASLIVSTVSGNDMLAAIIKSEEGDADTGLSGQSSASTSALKFAKGGESNQSNVAHSSVKPIPVSAGIALRSLVKGGKLAAQNSGNDDKSVQLVGATAASKLVVAVETLIIKTVNKALEGVKQAITTSKSNELSSKEK